VRATLTNANLAATKTDHTAGTPTQAVGRALATVLGLLTIFGPISMDLYLPVLPALTIELKSATSTAQLTVTACLLGLALGQVIAGPLSDRFGRRRPLLVGVVAYVVTSTLCALSLTIETLIVAPFVQGLAGAVGIVIAQAAGRDLILRAQTGAVLRPVDRARRTGGHRAAASTPHRLAHDAAHDLRKPLNECPGRRPGVPRHFTASSGSHPAAVRTGLPRRRSSA